MQNSQTDIHIALFKPVYLLDLFRVLYGHVWKIGTIGNVENKEKMGKQAGTELAKVSPNWNSIRKRLNGGTVPLFKMHPDQFIFMLSHSGLKSA